MPNYVITEASRWEFLSQLSKEPNNTVIELVRDKTATEKRVSEELRGQSNVRLAQADITGYSSLQPIPSCQNADTTQFTGSGLDYLIANAGLMPQFDAYDPIGVLGQRREVLEEYLTKYFKVNVVGNIHLFKIYSGQAALDMIPNYKTEVASLYSISKPGFNTAVVKFSAQYSKEGVVFMSICPGMADTGLFAAVTLEQLQGLMGIWKSFEEYAPHFKGPNGDGGSFVSHYGNQQWL
ncbi:NAD(P)-binding protein [Aspergillus alliaceus]|uniref:NAD(P)-binding protein n=1 Tax=Petromyces alliaceus TaxID=209559 RepID=UPI0012A3FF8A|nr:NAD(P)-binding protein [Aspergillus alliaceus]KAB8235394.1 NAD(P)-binding protein [Aspergillus alliaceus]